MARWSGTVSTEQELALLFDSVGAASVQKQVASVHPLYRALIEASPFVVLATSGPDGLDASPRGDAPGFVTVEDEHTLLLPERRGNNRIDSLRNIIGDPRVALLFLIPGAAETLRVNGRATIVTDPGLLERFAVDGKPFLRDEWTRPEGGGGISRLIEEGNVFERGGVNFSHVTGARVAQMIFLIVGSAAAPTPE